KDFIQSFDISVAEAPGHAMKIAKEAASCGDQVRIYSVGGDGTFNEIVNAVADSPNVELGIIPCGSGNDIARYLYPVIDPLKLIRVLPASTSTSIDLGKLNDKYFVNIASIGFDAEVVMNRQYFKKFPLVSGPMSYWFSIFYSLIKLKKYNLRITLDNKPSINKDYLLSIFANGIYYGGGIKAAPLAKMEDGVFDFYLIKSISRRKFLRFFKYFINGTHNSLQIEELDFYKGKKAVIESEIPFPVNYDGELKLEKHVTIEILPKHIKVIIP
ncbi:MAG: diacylglycerol/lipid kinase family protein, partial [Acetivibrionales bacterium]